MSSFPCKLLSNLQSDSSAGSTDQRDFSFETHHSEAVVVVVGGQAEIQM